MCIRDRNLTFQYSFSPRLRFVFYNYLTTGAEAGRLSQVTVHGGILDRVSNVAYKYQSSSDDYHSDLGIAGDTVQIRRGTRTTGGSFDYVYTQYRYYKNGDANGSNHQLKMEFNNEAIDRILRARPDLEGPEGILTLADNELVAGKPLRDFATRRVTYYTGNIATTGLEGLYGGTNATEFPSAVPGGMVRTVSDQTGCGSCGGGGIGTTTEYYYLDLHQDSTNLSDVARILSLIHI